MPHLSFVMELRQTLALGFSLALISVEGQELELWHDFEVCPTQPSCPTSQIHCRNEQHCSKGSRGVHTPWKSWSVVTVPEKETPLHVTSQRGCLHLTVLRWVQTVGSSVLLLCWSHSWLGKKKKKDNTQLVSCCAWCHVENGHHA